MIHNNFLILIILNNGSDTLDSTILVFIHYFRNIDILKYYK